MFLCPSCREEDGSTAYETESRRAFQRHILHAGKDLVRRRETGNWVDEIQDLTSHVVTERLEKKRRAQSQTRARHMAEQKKRRVDMEPPITLEYAV